MFGRYSAIALSAILIAPNGTCAQTNTLPAGTSQTQSETQAEPPGRIRVSSQVEMNLVQHVVAPVYPAIARIAQIQGKVGLRIIVAKNGAVREVHYVSGPPILMKAAMDAVRQWEFRPMLLNDEAVEVDTMVFVGFGLGWTGAEETLERKPDLAAKIQEYLPADTRVVRAALGFNGVRDFEEAVFAAHDLGIPFGQLKCTELGTTFCESEANSGGMNLSKAIQSLKPEMSKNDVKNAEKKAKEEAKALS